MSSESEEGNVFSYELVLDDYEMDTYNAIDVFLENQSDYDDVFNDLLELSSSLRKDIEVSQDLYFMIADLKSNQVSLHEKISIINVLYEQYKLDIVEGVVEDFVNKVCDDLVEYQSDLINGLKDKHKQLSISNE